MSDTFGTRAVGRVFEGGKFYATASTDVPANAIYFPAGTASGQFGIAEAPVKSGDKGSFATIGTFAFAKPNGWTPSAGRAVYYTPTTAVTGTIKSTAAVGDVFIGYEVVCAGIPSGHVWIDIVRSWPTPKAA